MDFCRFASNSNGFLIDLCTLPMDFFRSPHRGMGQDVTRRWKTTMTCAEVPYTADFRCRGLAWFEGVPNCFSFPTPPPRTRPGGVPLDVRRRARTRAQYTRGVTQTLEEYAALAAYSWVCNLIGSAPPRARARRRNRRVSHLECHWRTSAEYAGQAFNSWNVPGAPLLNTLARPSISGMSLAHLC